MNNTKGRKDERDNESMNASRLPPIFLIDEQHAKEKGGKILGRRGKRETAPASSLKKLYLRISCRKRNGMEQHHANICRGRAAEKGPPRREKGKANR